MTLRRLNRSVVNWIAPSFALPRHLDRSIVWIVLSLFGLPRHLDRSVVWIAPSFGSPCRLVRSHLVRSVVVLISPSF